MTMPIQDIQQIAARLKAVRQACGMSQTMLVMRMGSGMSNGKWNNYERGRDRITPENAVRFCIVTGATMDYIYRGMMGGLPTDLLSKMKEPPAKPPRKSKA
jgi:transcriptional regulator with XRE-family HTH domain